MSSELKKVTESGFSFPIMSCFLRAPPRAQSFIWKHDGFYRLRNVAAGCRVFPGGRGILSSPTQSEMVQVIHTRVTKQPPGLPQVPFTGFRDTVTAQTSKKTFKMLQEKVL